MDASADWTSSGIAFEDSPQEQRERQPAAPPEPPRKTRARARADKVVDTASRIAAGLKSQTSKPAQGRPLTAQEVEEMREPLIEAIKDYAEYADIVLSGTNRDHAQAIIWELDDREAAILADWRLARARVSPRTARSLQVAILFHQSVLKVIMIIGPRLWQTAQFMREHPLGGIMPQRAEESQHGA